MFGAFRIGLSCCLLAIVSASSIAQTIPVGENSDVLVICPEVFEPGIERWKIYRQQQGHVITVIRPRETSQHIKQQIRDVARTGQLKSVFLIGDMEQAEARKNRIVVPHRLPARVNVLFGSEPEIATDNPYADLDDDEIPDLAIGRLPADTVEEVQLYLDRVIEYESDQNSSCQQWRRRINFVAGVGGFGGVIDSVIQQTTKQIITDLVPEDYETSMTFGSWRSPYCPDPRRFSETAIERFNEGCLFWVYLGHGHAGGLDRIYLPDQCHEILDNHSVRHLNCQSGSPIAIFLACYTGAADAHFDCLAENMLRQPGGPIATVCGTRVTMPYAMGLLSLEMTNEYFFGGSATMGELLLKSKRRMVHLSGKKIAADDADVLPRYREMIDGMGKLLSPRADLLAAERIEHAHLIQLYGDPLLRLKRPQKITISSIEPVAGSERTIVVKGDAPADGLLQMELVYCRDRFRFRPPHRRQYIATDKEFQGYQQAYEDSHNLVCFGIEHDVSKGKFDLKLNVPDDANGRCAVRCLLKTPDGVALGSECVDLETIQSRRVSCESERNLK